MPGKASSRLSLNFFRRNKHSTPEGSEGPKNGDHQAGAAGVSPFGLAPSKSAARRSTAGIDPMILREPEQLWDQAYDDLKHDDPKLIQLYETILSSDLDNGSKRPKGNVIEQKDRTKRRSQMESLLNTGLDKTEKLANVETNIGDAINIVLSIKEAIGSGLQAVPIAALAWTGVCVALQASLSF